MMRYSAADYEEWALTDINNAAAHEDARGSFLASAMVYAVLAVAASQFPDNDPD
jgi:hypothetical protein